MSGEGPGGTGRFPQQRRPLKEGGSWGKHGFLHGSEAELAASVVGQSPTTRPNHGASDAHAPAAVAPGGAAGIGCEFSVAGVVGVTSPAEATPAGTGAAVPSPKT